MQVPAGLLHLVKHYHSSVSTHLMRLMSERLLRLVQGNDERTSRKNLSTVSTFAAFNDALLQTPLAYRIAPCAPLHLPLL
jgi:hypothetical protein